MLVVANWKMHGSLELVTQFGQWSTGRAGPVEVAICPPTTYLIPLAAALKGSNVKLGAQNAHAQYEGAFTGETSVRMLTECGCTYVILGHSERRAQCHETDTEIAAKLASAQSVELTPILCVGETIGERKTGQAVERVKLQLSASLEKAKEGPLVIAYEPVWAIGTGLTPSDTEIAEMHAAIRHWCLQHIPTLAKRVKLLYGGSVKPQNAKAIAAIPNVDGALVGGASLEPESFGAIVKGFE